MLSNYNIRYTCTIYTRLDTCIMSISRFSLCDKVTLWLLKLHLYGTDEVESCRALDIMRSDWCCSVSMVWVQILSREEHKFDSSKFNSYTVWFNFQTYTFFIIIYNILRNCCVRLLSNYNIKYTCIIYTRLDTGIMYISRFSLLDKVTLRLLKPHCFGADMVEWRKALDIVLSDWCRSASMMWVQIPSREK